VSLDAALWCLYPLLRLCIQGSASSSSSSSQRQGLPPRGTMESLRATGRYVQLPLPGGRGVAHCIGVFPCSTNSANEVALLCELAKPTGVYVDVFPEQLSYLQAELARYTPAAPTGDGDGSSADADAQLVIAVETARTRKAKQAMPAFSALFTTDLGLAGTATLRSLIADDEFFRLCGAGRDIGYEEVHSHLFIDVVVQLVPRCWSRSVCCSVRCSVWLVYLYPASC
jgi:hypothetical protein